MSLTTSPILGALTTTWTPPTPCLSTVTFNPYAIWAPGITGTPKLSPAVLLGATGQAADLVCYPPAFTQNHVYSPGICPSGWTSACAPTAGSGGLMLPKPTTAVQCCPSGLTCSDYIWCRGEPASTDRPVWSLWTDKFGIEGAMTTTNFPTLSVLAKAIIVAYESGDDKVFASAERKASSEAGRTQDTTTVTVGVSTSSSGSQGPRLSGSAIAGIAIGSLCGGILLATVITFLALRFCMGYRRTNVAAHRGRSTDNLVQELGSGQANEMHWHPKAVELPSQDRSSFKAELASPLGEEDKRYH
ncbi:hypothetical protein LTR37_003224 [Vermiconidia calcicola]|uniref:Uncharacterized protein n=1 Tax=Vermiconidia calcicola TaxID=1690605 RepID=A0ACC3NRU8_9PEZI|nr:hypothetical protein LTR37_003224 [Vermiconidia calcicola]